MSKEEKSVISSIDADLFNKLDEANRTAIIENLDKMKMRLSDEFLYPKDPPIGMSFKEYTRLLRQHMKNPDTVSCDTVMRWTKKLTKTAPNSEIGDAALWFVEFANDEMFDEFLDLLAEEDGYPALNAKGFFVFKMKPIYANPEDEIRATDVKTKSGGALTPFEFAAASGKLDKVDKMLLREGFSPTPSGVKTDPKSGKTSILLSTMETLALYDYEWMPSILKKLVAKSGDDLFKESRKSRNDPEWAGAQVVEVLYAKETYKSTIADIFYENQTLLRNVRPSFKSVVEKELLLRKENLGTGNKHHKGL